MNHMSLKEEDEGARWTSTRGGKRRRKRRRREEWWKREVDDNNKGEVYVFYPLEPNPYFIHGWKIEWLSFEFEWKWCLIMWSGKNISVRVISEDEPDCALLYITLFLSLSLSLSLFSLSLSLITQRTPANRNRKQVHYKFLTRDASPSCVTLIRQQGHKPRNSVHTKKYI